MTLSSLPSQRSDSAAARRRRHARFLAASIAVAAFLPRQALATPTVTTFSDRFVVNNGVINLTYYKTGGNAGKIMSITYDGQEMVGSKGIYSDIQGSPWMYLNSDEQFSVTTGSNYAILNSYHPATATEPLDVTWTYIIKDGEAGYHSYLSYHHTTAMADWASSENRFAQFFNESLFNYSSISDRYWGYQAAGDANRGQGRYITAETSDMRGVPSETTKAFETKYDWRTTLADSGNVTGIFGAPNTSTATRSTVAANYGVWDITNYRSNESWNAGPTHPQSPWADGASFILCPAGSHQGGPSLLYTGDMDKGFGPYFTYFNKGTTVAALRADAAAQATPANLDAFYDTLPLQNYVPTAGRGAVSGKVRMIDGSAMSGATVILSAFDAADYATDPLGQEYQRRAAGYNYWVTPNADGTFTLPDVRPGTYRVTTIRPGTYREATWDNITVTAGNTTAVGNLTYVPDIAGKGIFQVGTFDRTSGEFKRGNEFNNWVATFDYDKDFPAGVNYTVNATNPLNDSANWAANWGLNMINGDQDGWKVNFNLSAAPTAGSQSVITFAIVGQNFINRINVSVNGTIYTANFDHTADNASVVFRSGDTSSRILYRKLTIGNLKAGANTITFDIGAGGTGQELQWDAIRLDVLNPGINAVAQWNGGSGTWSDGTQWSTQNYNYTNINKSAGGLLADNTSTTFYDGDIATAPVNSGTNYYDAVINGGVVTLTSSPSVQRLSFLEGTLTASGSTRTLTANDAMVMGGGTLTGTGILNALTSTTITFSNTISGGFVVNANGTGGTALADGASLNVTGAGSQFNSSALNFGLTKATTLSAEGGAGISTGAAAMTIGSFGVVTILAGGTLTSTNVVNSGTLTAAGVVAVGAAGTLTNGGIATVSGTLTGAAVVNAAGLLTLSGTSSYTGATTVNGGTIQFAGPGSIGGAGASVIVNAGGAVAYGPGITDPAFLSRIQPASTGAFAVTSANASTNLDFTSGTLAPFAIMALGALGDVTYTGTLTPAGNLYRLGGGSGNLTFSPVVSGPASVVIGNAGSSGSVILNAANSYTGTTTLKGSTLVVATLGNGGVSGPIGTSSNAAANLTIDGGILRSTTTAGIVTDRLFTLGAGGATLDSSGSLGINFANSSTLAMAGTGARTLTLTGSAGNTTFTPGFGDGTGGPTTLLKTGTGTWTLGSGAKSYTGETRILAGTLQMGPGAAAPAGGGTLTIASAGTLDLNAQSVTIAALNDGPAIYAADANNPNTPVGWASPNGPGGGTVTNTSTARTLTLGNNNASGTFSGVIAGSISLIKTGSGTQILSGDSTYSGSTTIAGGTLQVGVGGTPLSTGPGDGGFKGKLGSGNIVNNATLVFNRGYYTTATNAISGTGTLKHIANAQLVLGSANTYTGPTLVGGGIANIGRGGTADGTGLAYTGDCALNVSVLANGGASSSIGSSTNAASNLVLDGGTLFKSSTGSSTTDRLFTVTQNGGAIYTSGALTFSNAGLLAMTGTGDRTLSLGGDSSSASTFGPGIPDPASGKTFLTKDRSATWILGSLSGLTYSGDTTLLMGTLRMGAGVALPFGVGKGNVVFGTSKDFSGVYPAVLDLNANNLNINGLAGGVAASSYSSVTNTSTARTLTLGNADATASFNGLVTGAISLVKTGLGTQTLNGVNTYTGTTTINNGALLVGTTGALPGTTKNVTVNTNGALGGNGTNNAQTILTRITGGSTGTFVITGSSSPVLDFSSAGAALPTVSLGALGTAATFTGTLTPYNTSYRFGGGNGTLTYAPDISGSFDVTIRNAGTVLFPNAKTYTGTTTVNGGTLAPTGSNYFPSSSSFVIAAAGTVDLKHTSQAIDALSGSGTLLNTGGAATDLLTLGSAGGSGTYSGALAGTLALAKAGAGTQGLGGGTFSLKSVAVLAGTLQVGDGVTAAMLVSPTLTLAGGTSPTSTLDLKNNALVLLASSSNKALNLSTLVAQLASGRNGGLWNGNGITSSTVAADATHTTTVALVDNADFPGRTVFNGQTVDANSLIIADALVGDADGSGTVDLGDFNLWFSHVGSSTYSYAAGDLDTSGTVDLGDFNLWFSHVGLTGAPLLPDPLPALAGAYSSPAAAVPEPASLLTLGLGALPLLRRARRR